jgi:hypothetical protein
VTPPPAGRASIILSEQSGNALAFPASLVFKGRDLYVTNLSLFDGGVNSSRGWSRPIPEIQSGLGDQEKVREIQV